MKCYVKSCIADFGADAKSSIKCNTLIMEIKSHSSFTVFQDAEP